MIEVKNNIILQCVLFSVALMLICNHIIFIFCRFFVHLHFQGGDSDDDAEGFAGSDDTQPSGDSIPPPSQDLEGISTYGEDDLVPEPHRVSEPGLLFKSNCAWVCLGTCMTFYTFLVGQQD